MKKKISVFVRFGRLVWSVPTYKLHYGGSVCKTGREPFRRGPLPDALVIVIENEVKSEG